MKIVKISSSQGSLGKNIGCETAPDFILDELKKNINYAKNFDTWEIKINPQNIDETNLNIEKSNGDIFLGGDHSITYSLFKGFAKNKKNYGLLIFDAHPDCAFYIGSVSHEDFVRKLTDEGILDKKNLVYVGIRKIGKSEKEFLKEVKMFRVKEVHEDIDKVAKELTDFFEKFKRFYMSIDIDILDPKFAPGTGYLEPNGLYTHELIYLVSILKKMKNLKRADLVEVNPLKDINRITVKNAANILSILME